MQCNALFFLVSDKMPKVKKGSNTNSVKKTDNRKDSKSTIVKKKPAKANLAHQILDIVKRADKLLGLTSIR